MTEKPKSHAHWYVRDTAIAMAHELYEMLMLDDKQYKVWKNRYPDRPAKFLEERFVSLTYPTLIEQARAALAGVLATTMDDDLKATIYEALLLDATLVRGRAPRSN